MSTRAFIYRASTALLTAVAGSALLSVTAYAQAPDEGGGVESSEVTQGVDEILVTGTRVRDPNLKSASPVIGLSSEALQISGSPTLDRVLNNLPQIAPSQNGTSNRGGGIATVDLRKLGPTRTLVLVNGRRFVPASGQGVVDLNSIPSSMIKRVDVVTGGASAVYGSDALAGVVNFILDDRFEGLSLRAEAGIAGEGDGRTTLIEGVFGSNFSDDRGNITIAASWAKRGSILAGDRPAFAVSVNGGSATAPAGRIDNIGLNPNPTAGSFLGSGGTVRDYAFTSDGNGIRGFINTLPTATAQGDRYNFSDKEYLQIPLDRKSVSALAHYEVADNITAFVEAFYTSSEVRLRQGESPLTNATLSPTNAALPQSARDMLALRPDPTANAIFQRRLLELGPRLQEITTDTLQLNAGLRGELGGGWSWEAFYGYGKTDQERLVLGGASQSRINASLLGCPGSTAQLLGCRVIDFFGPNSLTAADIAYIGIPVAKDTIAFQRDFASASVTGPIFDLPAGTVNVAFGAEYRKDSFRSLPDAAKIRGDLAGFDPSAATAGNFDVKEVFGELVVPLLADKPFFERLDIEAGIRYADYSSVGGVATYKLGGSWQPVSDLRARVMYQRATRAPSVFELFQAGDTQALTFTDPCATILPTGTPRPVTSAATAAICQLQGLADPRTTNFTQVSRTLDVNNVGNPDLREEKSKTLTAGVVLTPRFVPGLTLSVDYYDIKVEGYINRAFGGVSGVIRTCFDSGVTTSAGYAANSACALLSRRGSGELVALLPLANVQTLRTRGFDIQGSYSFDLGGIGDIDLSGSASYIGRYNSLGQNFSGRISQDFGSIPKWRTSFALGWRGEGLSARLEWRRIASLIEDVSQEVIPAVHYFDLTGRASIADDFEVYGGVNNLFDRRAPIVRNQIINTDPQSYDIVGRYFFLGVKKKF